MSASTVSRGRPVGRKSPLRVVNELEPFSFNDQPGPASAGVRLEAERPPELTAAQRRRLMISEFRDWLSTPDQPGQAAVPAG